ncbi:hypothetical protein LJR015_003927 [Peribacillus frigoritolerans]|uniref:hypothetical protein n=1 Tax=Peribacillus TaxID=2675229 RepID=UPI00296E65A3|nr:hypothetical protein [Peribacillus simplex]
MLAISCKIRDPGIEAHLLRAQNLTEQLVIVHNRRCQLELSKSYMIHIVHSSILHDIGKAVIPEGIYSNLAHYLQMNEKSSRCIR